MRLFLSPRSLGSMLAVSPTSTTTVFSSKTCSGRVSMCALLSSSSAGFGWLLSPLISCSWQRILVKLSFDRGSRKTVQLLPNRSVGQCLPFCCVLVHRPNRADHGEMRLDVPRASDLSLLHDSK